MITGLSGHLQGSFCLAVMLAKTLMHLVAGLLAVLGLCGIGWWLGFTRADLHVKTGWAFTSVMNGLLFMDSLSQE